MRETGEKSNWFERNPKKTLLAVTLLGIIVVIALLELGASVFLPGWGAVWEETVDFWVYDEQLGWAHKKEARGDFKHRDFSIRVRINSRGLRDSEYPLDRTEEKRMLVLGDSFGWGYGVEENEIFCEVIESRHPDWEIINASVSGYGTDQQLLYFRDRGIRYMPDVVLLLFTETDFLNNVSDEQYWHCKPVFYLKDGNLILQNTPVPKPALLQRLDRFFYGKTYFLKRIYLQFRMLGNRLGTAKKPVFEERGEGSLSKDETVSDKPKYRYTIAKRLLSEIHNLSKQIGARFVLVSTPLAVEDRGVLEDFCTQENVPYLPLDDSYSNIEEKVTFTNDEHWNPRGHEIAAAAVERFLRRLEIFE
ncbi:MAG: hypothetical protein GTO51_04835 [Candidatus Latescibacteria bacterium]|nr:hypothetical protein [Candidatus Latescibacterota bacterium]NIM21164.1 hypothetical protein [Candidatus Latescibacterota bacterium]NIM65299.1 hypothetical protein [Candidatus Latescibacterota bacterium]NIO01814.1 hypothetical protein [Candidatus Latescibacterota bacterium]NIO28331.1 hypothetical protein [Candidatus Latescibacterota bacterium]